MTAPPALNVPVKDQSPLPIGSSNPKDIWEALSQMRTDLMTLMYQAQSESNQTIHLSGAASVSAPVAGKADCWISSRIALAAGGGNYWTISVLRQGQAEQPQSVTNQNALTVLSYHEYFMGTFTVGVGDVLGVSLVSFGAPAALTIQDITIRCELTPRNNANA
jgi:hypothetical protein